MTSTLAAAALRLSDVRFTYPAAGRRGIARTALDGVALDVPAGECLALLGPNGSGKSTLMKVICGIAPPDAGSLDVFGERSLRAIRAMMGVVFQSPSLDRHLTVRENLRDQARLYGMSAAEAAERVKDDLEGFGLADRADERVKTLSGGLIRRADLCRALLHRPLILLLDEPTVGLDPAARQSFLALLDERRREDGLTVLMSTHLIDEADRADRVVLIHEGRIVADDTPAALRQALGDSLLTVLDPHWQPRDALDQTWRRATGLWSLNLGDDIAERQHLATLLAGENVPFSIAPPTLADVFERHTGRRLEEQEQDVPRSTRRRGTRREHG